MSAFVFVTLGTDHHPFDRAVTPVKRWAARAGMEVVVQGSVRSQEDGVKYVDRLGPDAFWRHVKDASIIVTHGGPATIAEVYSTGKPMVVFPRDPAFNEHVDDHQVRFAAHLSRHSPIPVAFDAEGLERALDDLARSGHGVVAKGDASAPKSDGSARFTLPKRPSILYVTGSGRSGSTLLERTLGEAAKYVNVGELGEIFRRGVLLNEKCSCGAVFSECRYWQAVGERAFNGWSDSHARQMMERKERLIKHSEVARIVSNSAFGGRRADELALYARTFANIYEAVSEISGSSVVVDGSKWPVQALVFALYADLDIRAIHLVRDSRGVAYSWQKSGIARPQSGASSNAEMATHSPLKTAVHWNVYNAFTHAINRRYMPYALVRYEEFVADPARSIERLLGALRVRPEWSPDHISGRSISLGAGHALLGNPSGYRTGRLTIRSDTAWTSEFPLWKRAAVTALTAPQLVRYGYGLSLGEG